MSKIKGKQLESSSIEQSKINVSRVSVVDNDNVTSKQYVDETIAEKATLYYSKLNLNMLTNNTTGVDQKACDTQVIEFPISNVLVKVNGSLVDVGETKDCYFSPDGVVKRTNGQAQKGDFLYWNSTKYNLDTTDEIDFIYLVGYYYYNLSGGTTVELNPVYNNLVVRYTGVDSTTMSVIIDGVTIVVGNVGGNFVWDIGGLDEHTFTYAGESIVININSSDYTVWFDGFGSLIFSVRKNESVTPSITQIKHGYLYNYYAIQPIGDDYPLILNSQMADIGWRVPTSADFQELITTLGGGFSAGAAITEPNLDYWLLISSATNSAKFNARGSGYKTTGSDNTFNDIKYRCILGTVSDGFFNKSCFRIFTDEFGYRIMVDFRQEMLKVEGRSIRLVNGTTTLSDGESGEYIGNDGKVYRTICIGTQEWLADNLAETKYRNGDTIPNVTDDVEWSALVTGARCAYDNDEDNVLI